ncbi:MAG: protein phosphatase 2C domain-containing protein [Inconstantimicrobium porci]|uniref:PP2C family protein-serine/threonine phosphatase n=1 Tax=Inconstantimicrobium porci TaxID=2652291 RepID=UPI002A920BF1|nr:protein phosphatase 2C domain-containing protein [Inconstantimicrobium porci]MDY5912417.1 protein phosphatase 2C domain-containing protein [Inconstantimicrobium porci]
MKFIATADTDIGIIKETNQDSILIKHASTAVGEVLLAAVCDGMGGLSKGELASATVIRAFSQWFEKELPNELRDVNMDVIAGKWELLLKDLNLVILNYGKKNGITLGTTFTGVLFINDMYLIAHIGDSRLYHINTEIRQETEDHTLVAREVASGNISEEQADIDKRRNILLQCIGASSFIKPQIVKGTLEKGVYMVCSDGFRHEVSNKEMLNLLNPTKLLNKKIMHINAQHLIDLAKKRRERDNISVVLIKVQ